MIECLVKPDHEWNHKPKAKDKKPKARDEKPKAHDEKPKASDEELVFHDELWAINILPEVLTKFICTTDQ